MESQFICLVRCEPYHDIEKVMNGVMTINNDKISKYIALPHTKLSNNKEWNRPEGIQIGALSMNSVAPGSFTESIASQMLIDEGVQFVYLGDRNGRLLLNETNQIISQKVKNSLEKGLHVVLALPESESQQEKEWIKQQLQECVEDLASDQAPYLTVVYQSMSPNYLENMDEAAQVCREAINEVWGEEIGSQIKVLLSIPKYTPNFLDYCNGHHIDGVCISGSMVEAESVVEKPTPIQTVDIPQEKIAPAPITLPIATQLEPVSTPKKMEPLEKEQLLIIINCQGYHDLSKTLEEINQLRSLQITKTPFSCYLSLPLDTLRSFPPEKRPKGLFVGSSEMNRVTPGHFTESVALKILTDNGADFVFLGTQRDRTVLGETDQEICEKVRKTLEAGIKPFVGIHSIDNLENLTEEEIEKISIVYTLKNSEDITAIRQQLKIPLILALPKYSQNILEICAHPAVDGACLSSGSILEELMQNLKKLPSIEQEAPYTPEEIPIIKNEPIIEEEIPIIKNEPIIEEEIPIIKKEPVVEEKISKEEPVVKEELIIEDALEEESLFSAITETVEKKMPSEEAPAKITTVKQATEQLQETVNTCSENLAQKYFESTYIPNEHDLESPEIKQNRFKNDFRTMFNTFKEKNTKGWNLLLDEMEHMQTPQREKVIQSVNLPLERLKEIADLNKMSEEVNGDEQKAFYQILDLSDDSMKALYEAAKSLFEKGRFTDAADAFYTIVSLNKNDYKGWFGLALSKKLENLDIQTAIDAFSFAEELDATAPEPLIHLADCYSMLGDHTEAKKSLEAAKELMLERDNSEDLVNWSKQVEQKLAA